MNRINGIENLSTKKRERSLSIYSNKNEENRKKFMSIPNLKKHNKIMTNVHCSHPSNCQMTCFFSKNEEYILVWIDKSKNSINTKNLSTQEEKQMEKNYISKYDFHNIRYCFDEINDKDLIIISLSNEENSKKKIDVFELESFANIWSLKNVHNIEGIFVTCMFSDFEQGNFIISCASEDYLKIFDENKKLIKKVRINKYVNYIDIIKDHKEKENYVIIAFNEEVISFNFPSLKLYNQFIDEQHENYNHKVFKFYENINKKLLMIDADSEEFFKMDNTNNSSEDNEWTEYGSVRIWDFHSANLLIYIPCNKGIYDLCLWNLNYLFCACDNKSIVLIDLNQNKITTTYKYQSDNALVFLSKIAHPLYRDSLISLSYEGNLFISSY